REGAAGRQERQGQSPATLADPLVQRQSHRRQTGDGESRQTDTGRGQGDLGHPGEEGSGGTRPPTTGLPAPPAPTRVHREAQWQETPSGLPNDDRPSDVGV